MRNMSFALTPDQLVDGSKTVTRRKGWTYVKRGELICACRKVMGRKRGEPLDRLAVIRVQSVTRELLSAITPAEVVAEGFPRMTPHEFVRMFIEAHSGVYESSMITRIQFSIDRLYRQEGQQPLLPPESRP